ncbi:MAG TPA: hypothetical protein VND92_10835 [Vicinamibacterales bacterium]|nr:hypothetical protein [Vicinamibacterales bacterium]
MATLMRWRRSVGLVGVVALLAFAAFEVRAYAPVVTFVVRAAQVGGWPGRVARWYARPFTETIIEIPSRDGPLRARLYRPQPPRERAALLVPGIHPAGIDEPRLVGLSRELAATGIPVLTPELPDMTHFRITAQATDMIEDAGRWLAAQPDLAPDGRIGMMGISFSGGLSVVAAGRAGLRAHVAYVFAYGGHGDLPRVLRYLCTGIEPEVPADQQALDPHAGRYWQPHDYGVAVILHEIAPSLVPADQVMPLRQGIETFLDASGLAGVDDARAAQLFARARAMASQLPEPAATLLEEVNDRNVKQLGPELLARIGSYGTAPGLSPDRSPPPTAPVFLLHGRDDNVVPSAESILLADWLRKRTHVHLLVSTLLGHAEVDRQARFHDVWQLIEFWKDMIAQ